MKNMNNKLVPIARKLRKESTPAERLLWKHLRNRQLNGWKFRRQFPLGDYIADFICLEQKLIIEVDGGQHATQIAADINRTEFFEGKKFTVLRFWNNEVLQNISGVVKAIEMAVGKIS